MLITEKFQIKVHNRWYWIVKTTSTLDRIPGLIDIMWKDCNGSLGLEHIYRNLLTNEGQQLEYHWHPMNPKFIRKSKGRQLIIKIIDMWCGNSLGMSLEDFVRSII